MNEQNIRQAIDLLFKLDMQCFDEQLQHKVIVPLQYRLVLMNAVEYLKEQLQFA